MSAASIDSGLRSFLLRKIAADWLELPPQARPGTIWVGEHEPTDHPDSPLSTPIIAAWLFDGREFHERPCSAMAAFLNLAAGYPYTTGTFEIGVGGFARIDGSEEIAMYWQFGGLLGLGYRCISSEGRFSCEEAWRS